MEELIAYNVSCGLSKLRPGTFEREWMNASPDRFAYRCLPLNHANEFGWDMVCLSEITAEWGGDNAVDGVKVSPKLNALSHFGCGILTFQIDYLFRTPENIGLLVTGPFNSPKDGIVPLTGLVETDWACATFTMNWKFTRPCKVVFKQDEPFCRIIPVNRTLPMDMEPVIKDIKSDSETSEGYQEWHKSRGEFIHDLNVPGTYARERGWQRDYFKGVGGKNHCQKLNLKEFKRV